MSQDQRNKLVAQLLLADKTLTYNDLMTMSDKTLKILWNNILIMSGF